MKAKEVKKILGITQQTLSHYVKNGTLGHVAINPFHYEYKDEDVYKLMGISRTINKINVTYSRVSLSKQKNDLESQTKRLYDYCSSKGISLSKQFKDIKSGMNFDNRKEFNELLKEIVSGNIDNIVVENKDRLCRFGFDLFETFCKYHGAKIVVTSDVQNKSYEQELTDDLVSIIHYFSMKSYSHRAKLNRIKKELQDK
jgi:predicted site-specific integrase-resolvase